MAVNIIIFSNFLNLCNIQTCVKTFLTKTKECGVSTIKKDFDTFKYKIGKLTNRRKKVKVKNIKSENVILINH